MQYKNNFTNELLPGVKVFNRVKHVDNRGNFSETWKIENDDMRGTFRQLNTAVSKQFVIRGMHRQDQSKLVMPIFGKIFDVILEPKTKKWCCVELDEEKSVLIPPQYAHGYMTLTENAIVQYVVDRPYNKDLEENFKWCDYSILWPTNITPTLSDKDR
jgi:dTDP-4-dehydrorhamnose 3,5-epimerase